MCLNPIRVYPNGKNPITHRYEFSESCMVACGKCLECFQRYSIEWAFRIMLESKRYKDNCFVTYTYNEEHLPNPPFVSRREVQLLNKRLRKALAPLKIRFFACGEYGKRGKRPHYHEIIFNWFPSDAYFWKCIDGVDYFRSPMLEKIWTKGFSLIGRVEYKTALYCAKYMNKFFYESEMEVVNADPLGDEDCPFWDCPTRPFVQMSNRPGIGFESVYESDMLADRIYIEGRSCKIPRYFLKVMERDGIYLDDLKERRRVAGQMLSRSTADIDARRKKAREFFKKKFLKNT